MKNMKVELSYNDVSLIKAILQREAEEIKGMIDENPCLKSAYERKSKIAEDLEKQQENWLKKQTKSKKRS